MKLLESLGAYNFVKNFDSKQDGVLLKVLNRRVLYVTTFKKIIAVTVWKLGK